MTVIFLLNIDDIEFLLPLNFNNKKNIIETSIKIILKKNNGSFFMNNIFILK